MAIFGVIDCADGGDTRYEGFVKDAANWALAEAILDSPATLANVLPLEFDANGDLMPTA